MTLFSFHRTQVLVKPHFDFDLKGEKKILLSKNLHVLCQTRLFQDCLSSKKINYSL